MPGERALLPCGTLDIIEENTHYKKNYEKRFHSLFPIFMSGNGLRLTGRYAFPWSHDELPLNAKSRIISTRLTDTAFSHLRESKGEASCVPPEIHLSDFSNVFLLPHSPLPVNKNTHLSGKG
jgi:hypothetical protein